MDGMHQERRLWAVLGPVKRCASSMASGAPSARSGMTCTTSSARGALMAAIDPDTALLCKLLSEAVDSRETIKSQRGQIIALVAILKAQERSVHVLTHLVSDLLTQERG
jgi:hypothetical protein